MVSSWQLSSDWSGGGPAAGAGRQDGEHGDEAGGERDVQHGPGALPARHTGGAWVIQDRVVFRAATITGLLLVDGLF